MFAALKTKTMTTTCSTKQISSYLGIISERTEIHNRQDLWFFSRHKKKSSLLTDTSQAAGLWIFEALPRFDLSQRQKEVNYCKYSTAFFKEVHPCSWERVKQKSSLADLSFQNFFFPSELIKNFLYVYKFFSGMCHV